MDCLSVLSFCMIISSMIDGDNEWSYTHEASRLYARMVRIFIGENYNAKEREQISKILMQ